jgi:hypothetical protein
MKAKLLKKVRAICTIDYYPSTKQYRCNGELISFHNKEKDALIQRSCNIINYCHHHYRGYSKKIRIK